MFRENGGGKTKEVLVRSSLFEVLTLPRWGRKRVPRKPSVLSSSLSRPTNKYRLIRDSIQGKSPRFDDFGVRIRVKFTSFSKINIV